MTMPNTTSSDLDRAALALESKLMEFCTFMEDDLETTRFDGIVVPALNQLRAALLPRASGVPEVEAVAWRFKPLSSANGWDYIDTEPRFSEAEYWTVEPLFAAPPPVAAPSGEVLAEDVAGDFEIAHRDYVWAKGCADFIRRTIIHYWRVTFPPSPIASEPKDAGSGEKQ